MADTLQDRLKALEEESKLLTQQKAHLEAQVQLLQATLTQQEAISKGVAERTKEFVNAQSELEKARASAAFAELLGIKQSLSSLGSAGGLQGTISLTKGGDGTALLRERARVLEKMSEHARMIVKAIPKDSEGKPASILLASDADVLAAYKSDLLRKAIADQTTAINTTLQKVRMTASFFVLPGVIASVQAVGLTLGAVNDLAKMFRVDRTVSIFDSGEDAQAAFEVLLERAALSEALTIHRSQWPTEALVREANSLLDSVNTLRDLYEQANARLSDVQKAVEAQSELPEIERGKIALPSSTDVEALKIEASRAKALVDSLDPAKSAEAFWKEVIGRTVRAQLSSSYRLDVKVQAQSVQVLEKRTWRSDRLLGAADVQVQYRVWDKGGKLVQSGLVAESTAMSEISVTESGSSFPKQ